MTKRATLRRRLVVSCTRTLAAALAVLLVACTSPFDANSPQTSVRLYNDSPFHLDHVRYSSGTDPVQVGRMEAGTYSTYHTVAVAYVVAYVEATIDGEIYASRAEHFNDYPRLQGGAFTYRITVDSARRLLTVTVVQD